MLQFCFPLSCHLFEMVFIPLLLEVMSLVLKLGRCVVSTDYYLTIIICTICIRHIPCSAECSSLLPPQSCTLCTTHSNQFSILSDIKNLVDTPWRCYISLSQLSKSVVLSCQMWQCPFYTLQIAPSVVLVHALWNVNSKQCLSSREHLVQFRTVVHAVGYFCQISTALLFWIELCRNM